MGRAQGSRGALVYRIAGNGPKAGLWRVRIEKYPEHSQEGTGWLGGRVLYHLDDQDRAALDSVADEWIELGTVHGQQVT